LCLWLHENGYTFFNIPNLTYAEISVLLDAKKRQNRTQDREQKRQTRLLKNKKR